MPVEANLGHVAETAFSQGSKYFDKWTKKRDEKHAGSVSTQGGVTYIEDVNPLPGELTLLSDGGQIYYSSAHPPISQLPWFALYHENDAFQRTRMLKQAVNDRAQIKEIPDHWLITGVAALTGVGLYLTLRKAENAILRAGAQGLEDHVAQKHICILSRYTAVTLQHGTLLVDVLDIRTSEPIGLNRAWPVWIAARASDAVRLDIYGYYLLKLKRGKGWGKLGYPKDLGIGVVVKLDGGKEVAMELVARQSRPISLAEIWGSLRHLGTVKRFEKKWNVPAAV